MLVALKVDKSKVIYPDNPKAVPFIESKTLNVDITSDDAKVILTVKNAGRGGYPKKKLPDYSGKCMKESVYALFELTSLHEFEKPVDVFIPANCECDILGKGPAYGLILSWEAVHLPYTDVFLQLNNKFVFIALPAGAIELPVCPGAFPRIYYPLPSYTALSARYQPPLDCPYNPSCGSCKAYDASLDLTAICEAQFALLVEAVSSVRGSAPSLDLSVSPSSAEYGYKLALNNKNSANIPSSYSNQYSSCKQIGLKVLKSLKGDLIESTTIYAKSTCECDFFNLGGPALILSKTVPAIYNDGLEFAPDMTIIFIKNPGEIILPTCLNAPSAPAPAELPNVYEGLPPSLPPLPQGCIQPENTKCPVCGAEIPEDLYCNSAKAFLVRTAVLSNPGYDGKCATGSMFSLYDVSVQNAAQKALLNIMYSVPSSCSCPLLNEPNFVLMILSQPVTITNPLNIQLSDNIALYSMGVGKLELPACNANRYTMRSRDGTVPKRIHLEPVDNELSVLWRNNMKEYECPSPTTSCPVCKTMEDEDLKELVCSADKAFLVKPDESNRRSRAIPRQTLNVTQDLEKSVQEIWITSYDVAEKCLLPVKEGKCSDDTVRFYFNAAEEQCESFTFSGCNGNENNFLSLEECEAVCKQTSYCDTGSFEVKKAIVNGQRIKPSENTYDYKVPTDCKCDYLNGGSQYAYIIYNETAEDSPQLFNEHHIIPLSDSQKDMNIACEPPIDTDYLTSTNDDDEDEGTKDNNVDSDDDDDDNESDGDNDEETSKTGDDLNNPDIKNTTKSSWPWG